MGCRPGDPQSARASLGEDDPGDFGELAADLGDHRLGRFTVGAAAFLSLGEQGFDARCSGLDQAAGTAVEQLLPCFAGRIPTVGQDFVVRRIRSWTGTERLDQAKRVADAGKPGDRFGISARAGFGIGKDVKHWPGVSGQG